MSMFTMEANTTGGEAQKKIKNEEIDEGKRGVVVLKKEIERNPLITEAQRRELDHQVFIFNHFAYNIPLPHYLLQFPTLVSEYGCRGSDYRTMLDSEPHRCRRTDGKKWRCGKNTVPNQKYCERHMHRGRNRSRKLVEASQLNSPNLKSMPSNGNSHAKQVPKIESTVSNPNPLVIQHSHAYSYTPPRSFCVVNNQSSCNRPRNAISSDATLVTVVTASSILPPAVRPKVTTASILPPAVRPKMTTASILPPAVGPKVTTFGGMASLTSNNRSRVNVCNQGFSPKSVLQVSGSNGSYLSHRNSIVESEPGRCRRTDGKRWRCKSAVLPGQKYCATHMHRGAKRRCTNTESPPSAIATTTSISSDVTLARLPYAAAATDVQKADCRIPNTQLSMSVPESAAPSLECKEKRGGGISDTDTSTTITDAVDECSYLSF
ncbi:growth-regulating factor 9-like [Vicia villosa]|uniref:growth-regulating factor 9-like n=1 Tax=Vicia villosa TaxID=3911 RepID=UPI00273CE8E6|nr:growth-regulating factor 9-like [Vicia villosa]